MIRLASAIFLLVVAVTTGGWLAQAPSGGGGGGTIAFVVANDLGIRDLALDLRRRGDGRAVVLDFGRYILAGFILGTTPAAAGVSAAEAAKLGTTLTAVGAEAAGNKANDQIEELAKDLKNYIMKDKYLSNLTNG